MRGEIRLRIFPALAETRSPIEGHIRSSQPFEFQPPRHQPRVVGSNGMNFPTTSDDFLFQCPPSDIIVGYIAESGCLRTTTRSVRLLRTSPPHGPPPLRRQWALPRLYSHAFMEVF